MGEVDVLAVNRSDGLVLLSSGDVVPVVTWMNCDGDELEDGDDRHEAVVAIAGVEGCFFVVWLPFFEVSSQIH